MKDINAIRLLIGNVVLFVVLLPLRLINLPVTFRLLSAPFALTGDWLHALPTLVIPLRELLRATVVKRTRKKGTFRYSPSLSRPNPSFLSMVFAAQGRVSINAVEKSSSISCRLSWVGAHSVWLACLHRICSVELSRRWPLKIHVFM